MKPRTYFGRALLFPYLLWCLCALIFFLISSREIPEAWNLVLLPISFYTFGIILWFIPYTVLAIGMWLWSKHKPTTALYKLALASPMLFFALMLLEYLVVTVPTSTAANFTNGLLGQVVFLGVCSMVFGYLSVGVALGVFRFLQSRNQVVEESSIAYLEVQLDVSQALPKTG